MFQSPSEHRAPLPPRIYRWCKSAAEWGLVITALLVSSAVLLIRIWYLLQPSSRFSDSNVYLAMGRGILNGLRPYVDLFEIKPPGMFFLSAASLFVFDNGMLGNWLSAVLLVAIPLIAAFWMAHYRRDFARGSLVLLGFTTSVLLVTYASIQSLPWQTELFGALIGMLYVLAITRQPVSPLQILLASLTLLASTGLKEPFLLSLLAAALILSDSFMGFVRAFVLPSCLAAMAGIVGLSALGLLQPYLTVYLGTMAHYSATTNVPLLLRGIRPDRFVDEWMEFSPLLPLSLMAWLACVGLIPLLDRTIWTRWNGIVITCRFLLAIYCAALSAGLAGTYFTQHFGFPIPAYFAFFVLCLKTLATHPHPRWAQIVARGLTGLSVAGLVTTASFTDAIPTNTGSMQGLRQSVLAAEARERTTRAVAASIDQVMDRCQLDRYFLIHSQIETIFGYTRHSPANYYLFAVFPYEFLANPALEAKTSERLDNASIIVSDSGGILLPASKLGSTLLQTLKEDFTTKAWPCAGSFDVAPYHVFFRRRITDADAPPLHVAQRAFEDYAVLFPRLTTLADYQFDELRYATWRRFGIGHPYQDLHFAVVLDPDLTVYLYNRQSLKFESRIVFDSDHKTVLSYDTSVRGFTPAIEQARMR